MSDEHKDNESSGTRMNILKRIMTAIRVESRVLSEAVMDSAGSKKFPQLLEDAKVSLQQAKSVLTEEMANELQSSRLVKILEDKINQQELLIVSSLSDGDEDQAFKLATEMVDLEQDREAQRAIQRSHELHLGHLQRQMEQAERSLKELERQLSMVNTTERIQKATEVITQNFTQADTKMLSAKKSLDRIRKKQQRVDEQYEIPESLVNSLTTKNLGDKSNNEVSGQAKDGAADVLKRIIDKD